MPRFDFVPYDDDAAALQGAFKAKFTEVEMAIEKNLAPGRSKALVLTKLEEAYMWIGKALRDDQLARDGAAAELQK